MTKKLNKLSLLFFTNILLLCNVNCYVKIPFKYFPVKAYNATSPKTIMNNILQVKIYGKLEMGTPKQAVELPFTFDSNDFYIANDPGMYNDHPEFFKGQNFFDPKKSTSLKPLEVDDLVRGDNFDMCEYHNDFIYINNKKTSFDFYLPEYLLDTPESGGIGLQILPADDFNTATPNETRSFFGKLKEKKLLNDYYWSVFFNTKGYKKEEEGTIILGPLPHELDSDIGYYKKSDFDPNSIRTYNDQKFEARPLNQIDFDGVVAYKGNNRNDTIAEIVFDKSLCLQAKFDYNLGGIKASYSIFTFLEEKVFGNLISRGECFKDVFKIRTDYDFFYCKKSKDTLSKIKESFPSINFRSGDLDYFFDINPDELFAEEGDYLFCLMVFDKKYNWVLGKPFLKKYQLIFNPEKKVISFYSMKGQADTGISKTTFVIVIIIVVLVVAGVCGLVGKLLFDKFFKKKRANELDEDYDYSGKNDQNNNEGLVGAVN